MSETLQVLVRCETSRQDRVRQLALKLLIRDKCERVEGTSSSVVQMVGPMAKCRDPSSSWFFSTDLETSVVFLASDALIRFDRHIFTVQFLLRSGRGMHP